jgi:hypothetical protein
MCLLQCAETMTLHLRVFAVNEVSVHAKAELHSCPGGQLPQTPSVLNQSPYHNFSKFTAIDLYISPISTLPLAYFWSTPEHRPDSQLRLHHGRPKPHLRLRRTGTREVSRSPTSSPACPPADLPHSPPLSARVSRSIDSIYNFFGLYFASLFSVCAARHPANLSSPVH